MRSVTAVLAGLPVFFGCPRPTPTPARMHALRLVVVGDTERPIYQQGASAWAELGIEIGFQDRGLPECPQRWTTSARCQITIGIVRVDGLREVAGTNAKANRATRRIEIDTDVTAELELRAVIAHEVGHVVLDTPRHTVGGIMGGSDWMLHDVDRALACETIGICR